MNEQEHVSQLSALFDNELPREQAEMVIRRALRDPSMRANWGRYALIGACIRGEPVAGDLRHRPDIAARVRKRLAGEPEAVQESALAGQFPEESSRKRLSAFGRGALGGALAAGVAAVSLLLVRAVAPQASVAPALVAQQPAGGTTSVGTMSAVRETQGSGSLLTARDTVLPSYTTPVNNAPAGRRMEGPLVNYVVAHSEVAASVVRFSPLSSVVNGNYDLTQGTVEMTAAEIGAHR